MKRKALFMCLSDRAINMHMVLVDKLELAESKTGEMSRFIDNLMKKVMDKKDEKKNTEAKDTKKKKSVKKKLSLLVVCANNTAPLARVGRNITGMKVVDACSLNVVDILTYNYLLLEEEALKILEKHYLKS